MLILEKVVGCVSAGCSVLFCSLIYFYEILCLFFSRMSQNQYMGGRTNIIRMGHLYFLSSLGSKQNNLF